MRIFILAGIVTISSSLLPPALSAQTTAQASTRTEAPQSAAEANARIVPGPPTTETVRGADSRTPDTIITTYPGNLAAPPASAMNKSYPVCTATLRDNCQNRAEARAQSRSRAPGQPRDRAGQGSS